jgi:uncharacterized protein (TIGR02246 family)
MSSSDTAAGTEVGSSNGSAGGPGSSADLAAVVGVVHGIVAAWAEHDADAFAAVFTEDGTMVLPGDVYKRGRGEVRGFMAAAFQGPYRGTQVTGQPLGIRFISADVAVMITEGGVLAPGETEVAPERQIKATWVVVRQGAGWQLAAYHNSPSKAA